MNHDKNHGVFSIFKNGNTRDTKVSPTKLSNYDGNMKQQCNAWWFRTTSQHVQSTRAAVGNKATWMSGDAHPPSTKMRSITACPWNLLLKAQIGVPKSKLSNLFINKKVLYVQVASLLLRRYHCMFAEDFVDPNGEVFRRQINWLPLSFPFWPIRPFDHWSTFPSTRVKKTPSHMHLSSFV